MCIITICKIFRCWHLEPIFHVDRCLKAITTHIRYCNRECTPPVLVGRFSLASCAICAHQNSIPTHVSELESSPPASISNSGPNSNSSSASRRALTPNFVSHPNSLSLPTHPSAIIRTPILNSTHHPSHGPLDEPYLSLFRSLPHFVKSFSHDPEIDPNAPIYTPPHHPPSSFTHLIAPDWLEPISEAVEQTEGRAAELLWDWFPFEYGTPSLRGRAEYERFFEATRVEMEVLELKDCQTQSYANRRWGDGEVCLCERGLELDAHDEAGVAAAAAAAMRGARFNAVNYNAPSLTGLVPLTRPASPLAPGQVWVHPGLRQVGGEAHRLHVGIGIRVGGAVEEDEREADAVAGQEEMVGERDDAVMREG